MESLNITLVFRRLEANTNQQAIFFLAALSSSRSLVVCLSVGWLVGWLVCWSLGVCEKMTLEYQMVNKTFLKPTYLHTYGTVVTVVTKKITKSFFHQKNCHNYKSFTKKTFFHKRKTLKKCVST